MAVIYSKTCDICGNKALRRESYVVSPASSTKQYVICPKCGKSIGTFLKKKGLLKTMKPKAVGSQKERKLKTKRR